MSRVIVEDPAPTRVVLSQDAPHVILAEPDEDDDQLGVILTQATSTAVVIPLEPAAAVIVVPDTPTQVIVAAEPPGVLVVQADPDVVHVMVPVEAQHVTISSPDETGTSLVAVSNRGPKGDPGDATTTQQGQQWVQDLPAAIWTIPSTLDYAPAGIIVYGQDGAQYDGFLVQYAGPDVRLIFDIPLAGTAWLS